MSDHRTHRAKLPSELARRLRSHSKRNPPPACPCCGQQPPSVEPVRWAKAYEHRCPHDVPCGGFVRGTDCVRCFVREQPAEAV